MNRLGALREQTSQMVDALAALVSAESFSSDLDAVRGCAEAVTALGRKMLGSDAEWIQTSGRPHLAWRLGGPTRVLLLGHLDTVWPTGTISRWPFAADGERATGPGAFDMKAGIVQGMYALSTLSSLDGVTLLINSDEELGSGSSRELIEREAKGVRAALVLEPSARGALKTGRKGVGLYDLDVRGRAAHAGLEPEAGINAVVELSHQVLWLSQLSRADVGTTVTPTVASAGSAQNTVPAQACVHVDVRCSTPDEQQRVDAEIKAARPTLPGAEVGVRGGPNRPPLPESSSSELFELACRLAIEIGIGPLEGVVVGGGSDGNFTAGVGAPTLDGLGPVGDGAHAEGEHVIVPAMAERAALVAALIEEIA
jgi:glutamate carboxypeptidase